MKHQLKTTNIKGKAYVQVNERVKAFRTLPEFKGFALLTEILHYTDEEMLMRAVVKDSEGRTISIGHAHETKSGSRINQTSMFENCETSAIGRALGNLGIGVDASIDTAETVERAIAQQEIHKEGRDVIKGVLKAVKATIQEPDLSNAPENLPMWQANPKSWAALDTAVARVADKSNADATLVALVDYYNSKYTHTLQTLKAWQERHATLKVLQVNAGKLQILLDMSDVK